MTKSMYEKQGETIDAREFLDVLESDVTDITLTTCTIKGVVDMFSSEIERDENDRIFLNKSLSCNGCTFTNVVNFRSVVFQNEISFRRSIFEADLDFDEATLQHQCEFREVKFQGRANFHSAIFHRSVSFWRAEFHNVADFHQAQFHQNAVFHEAQFQKEANLSRVYFHQTLDCTGTNFAGVSIFSYICRCHAFHCCQICCCRLLSRCQLHPEHYPSINYQTVL